MIKRNYAKTFFGLATRIISKIVSLTLAQFVNKFHNKKPINEIKYAFSSRDREQVKVNLNRMLTER